MKSLNKNTFIAFILILVAGLTLLNLISRNWFFRWDLTDNKMYSLSESSMSVVDKIDDILTMKVYFSNNLPREYGNNKRYLQDILEEYAAHSSGNVRFEFFEPDSDEDMQDDAQRYGIRPVQLQVIENDNFEVKRVYMGMVFIYEDQREIIPVIQTTTGLEYDITTKIKKLVDTQKDVLGIVSTGDPAASNENISQILNQRYDVRSLSQDSSIPEEITTLLINGFKDSLSTNIKDELNSFIARGGKILLAQNRIDVDIQTQQATPIESDIFDFLDEFGLHINENLVLDQQCGKVNVQQNRGIFRMAVPMSYPFLPLIQNFNDDEVIVNGLESVMTMFASEISIESNPLVNVQELFSSSDRSTTMTEFYNLNPDPNSNPVFQNLIESGKLLAVRSEIKNSESNIKSQLILVSDSKFLLDGAGGASPENHIFIMNAVDYLMGDSELIALRSREITNRPLEVLEDTQKSRWKWANILLPSFMIVGFGFIRIRREKTRAKFLEELYD